MMHARRVRYELRRLGALGLVMPVLVALLFCGTALLSTLMGAEKQQVARILVAGLELGLPLAAGVVAASVTADEPAIDLQLTVKTRYRHTLALRLVLLVGWTAPFALAWASVLHLLGFWELRVPEPFLVGQLVWVSPLLWFVAAGALLALLFRSRTASGAILGGIWVFENLFRGLFVARDWLRPEFLFATTYAPGAEFWLSNRLALISTALLLGLCVWLLSSGAESLAKGGEA